MGYHIHNLKVGESVWGPRGIVSYTTDANGEWHPARGDWQWWRVASIVRQGDHDYRLELVGDDGVRDVAVVNEDLVIAARDADGQEM